MFTKDWSFPLMCSKKKITFKIFVSVSTIFPFGSSFLPLLTYPMKISGFSIPTSFQQFGLMRIADQHARWIKHVRLLKEDLKFFRNKIIMRTIKFYSHEDFWYNVIMRTIKFYSFHWPRNFCNKYIFFGTVIMKWCIIVDLEKPLLS